MLRIILELIGHVDWSWEKTEQKQKEVIDYLKEHKIDYVEDPLDEAIIIETDTKTDFLESCAFLTDKVRAPLKCVHIPYETLCVNGEGKFEAMESLPEGMKIDDFVFYMWQKKVEFPKLDPSGHNK